MNDSNVTDQRIRCGHCGNYHASVAEVKNCATNVARTVLTVPPVERITPKQLPFLESLLDERELPEDVANYMARIKGKGLGIDRIPKESAGRIINLLLKQPKRAGSGVVPDSIPDGRYAFQRDGDKVMVFYRVTTARGDGTRFVQKVLGSPGYFRYVKVNTAEAKMAISKIVDDPAFASQLFGHSVGACGVCGSPLTDPESIRLGIGPVCAKKYDW